MTSSTSAWEGIRIPLLKCREPLIHPSTHQASPPSGAVQPLKGGQGAEGASAAAVASTATGQTAAAARPSRSYFVAANPGTVQLAMLGGGDDEAPSLPADAAAGRNGVGGAAGGVNGVDALNLITAAGGGSRNRGGGGVVGSVGGLGPLRLILAEAACQFVEAKHGVKLQRDTWRVLVSGDRGSDRVQMCEV